MVYEIIEAYKTAVAPQMGYLEVLIILGFSYLYTSQLTERYEPRFKKELKEVDYLIFILSANTLLLSASAAYASSINYQLTQYHYSLSSSIVISTGTIIGFASILALVQNQKPKYLERGLIVPALKSIDENISLKNYILLSIGSLLAYEGTFNSMYLLKSYTSILSAEHLFMLKHTLKNGLVALASLECLGLVTAYFFDNGDWNNLKSTFRISA